MQHAPDSSIAVADPPAAMNAFPHFLRRIFSFPVAIAFLLAALAVCTVRSRFDDPDMWWHLKMGQVIWTTHTIPLHDIFSYTTNHHASVPQEWLGEVSIYLAYKLAGYSGMMAWLCLFAAAILVGAYWLSSFYSGNLKVGFLGGLIVWLFSTVGLSIRPQMIGYLLLIVELAVIYLGRTRSPRWFLCLPILFALWINCHGSFILGIAIAAMYLFSSLFHFEMGSLIAERWEPARRKMLAIGLALSLPALFLNPDGIHQILYPVKAFSTQGLALALSQEWQATPLTDARAKALLLILLASFLLVILRRSQLFFDELLTLCAATWLGLSHQRTLFAFGILAAPILCRQLAALWDNYEPEKEVPWMNAVFIAGALLVAISLFPSAHNLETQAQAKSPVKAVAYILNHHLRGPMLNDYLYGGYLIWAAPQYPVMIDGRADVYEWSGFFDQYVRWMSLGQDPRVLLQKYGVNFCLLTQDSPMVQVLALLPDWKKVYSDSNSVVFERDAAENRP